VIPRIIHQIWWQGVEKLPAQYQRYRQGWMRLHPDWRFEFWDEPRCRAFMRNHYPGFAEMFDRYPLDIQRMDSVRYFILNEHGGVYLDCDMECYKPIDSLVEGKAFLLSKTMIFNNAVIGSSAFHPFWTTMFEMLRLNVEPPGLWDRSRSLYAAESCGPGLFNRAVRSQDLPHQPAVQLCPGFYFEPGVPSEWQGKVSRSSGRSQSYAVHHMHMGWLPPLRRSLSKLSAQILKLYWIFR
jgi:hypothetical protein